MRRVWRTLTAGGVAAALLLAGSPAAGATTSAVGARPGSSLVRGLDISAYQHLGFPINWLGLERDGLRFVAVKVTEGAYYANPYYRLDAGNAARAGLAIMPYVFANPSRAGGAATARFAVRVAGYRRGSGTLPLAVDLENDPYAASRCYGLNPRRMIAWIAGFTARSRALTGKRPVIYTTADWWRRCTRSSGRFRLDPLWVADYGTSRPAVPPPWRKWGFWQYADNGFLPGIGRTDLDYFQPAGEFSSLRPAFRHKVHRTPTKHHRTPTKHHRKYVRHRRRPERRTPKSHRKPPGEATRKRP